MTFVIKAGKLLPVLQVTLLDENGDAVNLESASGVAFRMRRVGDDTDLFINPAGVVDATEGIVQYVWSDGDTDDAGTYEAEFIVTTSGKEQAYPGDSDLIVEVFADDTVDVDDLVFCTPEQARAIVRKDVDLDDLALAHTIVSLRTAVPLDADGYYADLDDQDKAGLRQAVALTARWLPSQPDYFDRLNVSQESADGESRTYTPGALLLPAIAEWALANTRFSGSGMYSIDTPRDRAMDTIALAPYSYREVIDERTWRKW